MIDTGYWKSELEAYLDQRLDQSVLVTTNGDEVVFATGDMEDGERAVLINDLGRGGFRVMSPVRAEMVAVDAKAEKLEYSYADPAGGDGGGE